jgi:hypothetical protein
LLLAAWTQVADQEGLNTLEGLSSAGDAEGQFRFYDFMKEDPRMTIARLARILSLLEEPSDSMLQMARIFRDLILLRRARAS